MFYIQTCPTNSNILYNLITLLCQHGYEIHFDWTPWHNASTLNLYQDETCDCHQEPGSLWRQFNGIHFGS